LGAQRLRQNPRKAFRFRSTTPWAMLLLSNHFRTSYEFFLTSEFRIACSNVLPFVSSFSISTCLHVLTTQGKCGLSDEAAHDLRSWGIKVPLKMYYNRLRENHYHYWHRLQYKYLMFLRHHQAIEICKRTKRGLPGVEHEFPRCVVLAFPLTSPPFNFPLFTSNVLFCPRLHCLSFDELDRVPSYNFLNTLNSMASRSS
jgi:hypothetical protein